MASALPVEVMTPPSGFGKCRSSPRSAIRVTEPLPPARVERHRPPGITSASFELISPGLDPADVLGFHGFNFLKASLLGLVQGVVKGVADHDLAWTGHCGEPRRHV